MSDAELAFLFGAAAALVGLAFLLGYVLGGRRRPAPPPIEGWRTGYAGTPLVRDAPAEPTELFGPGATRRPTRLPRGPVL